VVAFPSLEWFQELARVMNDSEAAFKRFGSADVVWAVEVQPSVPAQQGRVFRMVFEDYGCTAVEELAPEAKADAAFTLRATYDTWREMIQNIRAHDGPDLQHSLNRLALMDDPIYVAAPDFLSRDLFARYGQTYQLFFNGAVHVPTEFPSEPRVRGGPPGAATP
jgi:hypothetical protein